LKKGKRSNQALTTKKIQQETLELNSDRTLHYKEEKKKEQTSHANMTSKILIIGVSLP
jgi:hypothetical protein